MLAEGIRSIKYLQSTKRGKGTVPIFSDLFGIKTTIVGYRHGHPSVNHLHLFKFLFVEQKPPDKLR